MNTNTETGNAQQGSRSHAGLVEAVKRRILPRQQISAKKTCNFVFISLFVSLLSACNMGYQTENGRVVYRAGDEDSGVNESVLKGADARSFQKLNEKYGKDQSNVYFRSSLLEGADARSFSVVSIVYAKDKRHVYADGRRIAGADPETFKLFDYQTAHDKNDIYYLDQPWHVCDVKSFVLLEDPWAKDNLCVYASMQRVNGADASSFVPLNFTYARDNSKIYTWLGPLEGAHYPSFRIVTKNGCNACARDMNRCYLGGRIVSCSTDPLFPH